MLITTPSRVSAVSSRVNLQDWSVITRMAPSVRKIAGVGVARRSGDNVVVVGTEVAVGVRWRNSIGISGLKMIIILKFSNVRDKIIKTKVGANQSYLK